MADFGVEVNTVQFEGAMQVLKQAVRDGMIHPDYGTLTVQARMLAEQCQKITPPDSKGQGMASVMLDLTRIYCPVSDKTWDMRRFKKIIQNDDRTTWNKVSTKFGSSHGLNDTIAVGFSPNAHAQNKFKRMRKKAKYGNMGTVTLGPQAKAARDYIKTVQGRVGWAKAGWNRGIIGLGGTVSTGWIGKHGMVRGKLIDGRSDYNPYIGVVNDTGWARNNRGQGERVINWAIQKRIQSMYSYAHGMCYDAAASAMSGKKVMKSRGGFGGFIPMGMAA